MLNHLVVADRIVDEALHQPQATQTAESPLRHLGARPSGSRE